MPNKAVSTKGFRELIKDLKAIIEEGKQAVLKVSKKPIVQMYWKLGRRVSQEGVIEDATVREIARCLDFEESLMSRIIEFYQFWPKLCPSEQTEQSLSWGHFKYLLPIKDEKQRNFYLTRAAQEGWSRNLLAQRIKSNYYQQVKSKKSANKSKPAKLDRAPNALYLYAGKVERVVDGDTLVIHVDLGFDVWISKRIRLRGIDCPELSTPEGQRAKEFVQEQLKGCERVIIQTFKRIDIYGRYVCDLFYLAGETDKEFIASKGNFLNQRLLDEGLAKLI